VLAKWTRLFRFVSCWDDAFRKFTLVHPSLQAP
jgi:hypothetical protein